MPKRRGSPRRRGPPRRGHVHLGEPGDSEDKLSGPPMRKEATARRAYDCLRPVWGRSHGPICDCCGLLRGPLCDLFEYVIAFLRVTCLDVNMCVLVC